jgi:TetR/AcrR family transcriptional repressor of lmrAB and yxaGH operons
MPAKPKHRDKIVRAAAESFRRHGYAATGTNEIVARSGAPKGSLYHYFPGGKAEIAAAAVDYAGGRVTTTLAGLMADHGGDPAAAILAYGGLLVGWLEKSDFRDGCPIATTLLEIAPMEEAVTQAGRAAFANWAKVFAEALEHQNVASERAESLGMITVMLLEGCLVQARVEQGGGPIVRAVETAAALFTAALAEARR